ncbi:MAG: hypothetical protein AAF673_02630 [Pseudomonadota bacterium]
MSNKKLTFPQVIQKFDSFEKKFAKNPGDKSLFEFFEVFGKIINEGGYTSEQLQKIRDRMLKLREIFSETRKALSEKSNETLNRHKNVSQYIKTSHIKNK